MDTLKKTKRYFINFRKDIQNENGIYIINEISIEDNFECSGTRHDLFNRNILSPIAVESLAWAYSSYQEVRDYLINVKYGGEGWVIESEGVLSSYDTTITNFTENSNFNFKSLNDIAKDKKNIKK